MKIVFTGGGTSGHFYPLMAVAEQVLQETYSRKLIQPKMYYFASNSYNSNMLYERGIVYVPIPSGKLRVYFSFRNIIDSFKTFFGFFVAFFRLLVIYPDVIFAKGGYDSLPTSLAAFILRIPIVLHESDSVPGRVSRIVSKLSNRVALSYKESASYFDNKNLAYTGQPIIEKYLPESNYQRHYLDSSSVARKTILITGGSQGSTRINDAVLQILPQLCAKYRVIHQVGDANVEDIKKRAGVILEFQSKENYFVEGTLDFSTIYPSTDLAIARSGSSLFELAAWQIPTIAIPLPESHADHQKQNALIAEKVGWLKMVLEENVAPSILLNQIDTILSSREIYEGMATRAQGFTQIDASKVIANELINIVISHDK